MKRPWQVWVLYALCLAVVVPAMAWLSHKAIQLDEQRAQSYYNTELARREAQLQERISSALWRIDWMLTPLIAQEAARPYFVYQPFYEDYTQVQLGKGEKQTKLVAKSVPSPLLSERNDDFVKLHFQVDAMNQFVCPKCPDEDEKQKALVCGLKPAEYDDSCLIFEDVKKFCDYNEIFVRCSPEAVPAMAPDENPNVQFNYGGDPLEIGENNVVNYEINNPWIQQQLLNDPQQLDDQKQKYQSQSAQQANLNVKPQTGNNRALQQREWNNERGNQELVARDQATKNYMESELNKSFSKWSDNRSEMSVREGIMRPLWIDDKLILARQVDFGSKKAIQCCWLDWEKIRSELLKEIRGILPHAKLEPLYEDSEVQVGRVLATLPIEIVAGFDNLPAAAIVADPIESRGWFSGIRLSLLLAWTGLLLGAIAAGVLLQGVIKLSERRATFVSAVTHELRTPLTTFRMYAEMLAEKMLPSDEKRQEYANTLRVEADRLSHLVENVLQFARLERGCRGGHRETLSFDKLIGRMEKRFADRAKEAGMSFRHEVEKELAQKTISTEPAAVEHVLFNLVDNACKYACDTEDKRVEMTCRSVGDHIEIAVRDYGPGIDSKQAAKLFQAFCKSDQDAANSAPGVGLGLALSKKLSRDLRGELRVDTTVDEGARFVLSIPLK